MNSKSPRAKTIKPPLGRWLTNGSASSGAAGKPTHPATRSTTSRACAKKAHPCSPSPPQNQKLLDSSPSDGLLEASGDVGASLTLLVGDSSPPLRMFLSTAATLSHRRHNHNAERSRVKLQ